MPPWTGDRFSSKVNFPFSPSYLIHFPKGSVAQFPYNLPKLFGVQVSLHVFVLLLLLLAPQLEDLTEIKEGHFSCPAESLALKELGTIKGKVCGASSPARARGPGRSRLALPEEGGAGTGLRPRRGARGPRGSDGPSGAVDTSLAGPGGCTCPGAGPRPAPPRTGPPGSERCGRPRRLALGPCQGASPGAAATPGPGSDRRPRGTQRRGRAVPPGPPRPLRNRPFPLREARASPRLWGAAASLAASTHTASARSARGRRRRLAARPRPPAARMRARPGHAPRALARACPLAPRTRTRAAGLAGGGLAGACGGRCGGCKSASSRCRSFELTSGNRIRVVLRRGRGGLHPHDPVDCAGGCCLILLWGEAGKQAVLVGA